MANPTYKKRIPNVPYLLANAGFEMHKENLFGGKEITLDYLLMPLIFINISMILR